MTATVAYSYYPVFDLFDERGNTSLRLDRSGNILSAHVTDAYGTTLTRDYIGSSANDPYAGMGGQFGYEKEPALELYRCGLRHYDPTTGRWLTRDPIGYDGGANLYGYVSGNPIMDVDPLGLQPPYTPGTTIWIDPKTLLTSRQLLDTGKVNNSYLMSTRQGTAPPPIEISPNGVIIQGNSRARVAAHFGDLIQCEVKANFITIDESIRPIMSVGFDQGPPGFLPQPSVWSRVIQGVAGFFKNLFTMGRNSGSGGAGGAIVTIGLGAEAAGKGLRAVLPYAQTQRDIMRDLGKDPAQGEIPGAVR